LALPEVETPYLAHHFYMPGIRKPVLVFIQRKFVTIYSKVCNKPHYGGHFSGHCEFLKSQPQLCQHNII